MATKMARRGIAVDERTFFIFWLFGLSLYFFIGAPDTG
jgi:hypothetical protein